MVQFFLYFLLLLIIAEAFCSDKVTLTDEAYESSRIVTVFPATYEKALNSWGSILDICNWMGNCFSYDMERAARLGDDGNGNEKPRIYTPKELYVKKKGVCIDLARFAVETTRSIKSSIEVSYLMIEFEPVMIQGSVLKKHWMAVYRDEEKYMFFADSKRPGFIAGPFDLPDDFIREYQEFRKRRIISHKILKTYHKKKRKQKQL